MEEQTSQLAAAVELVRCFFHWGEGGNKSSSDPTSDAAFAAADADAAYVDAVDADGALLYAATSQPSGNDASSDSKPGR